MIEAVIKDILTPKREYTPIPFWFLNDRLEKEKLRAQLEDFNEKGVNGVVIHPRMGIPESMEYLSDEYFDVIEFIAETAAELDMKLVLYDEAMYPSGSAHGLVVKSDPELASHGITLARDACGEKILAEFEDGYKLISRKTGGTIRGVHYGEDDGEAAAPMSADILNPEAVDEFIRLTHERYYSRLKRFFGSTVIGFFTDEPSVTGRCAGGYFGWTPGLEDEFTAAGGSLSELRSLFENGKNISTELYKKLITKRLNDTYYKKLSDWCSNHDIWLMGHPAESDDIDEQTYFHVPGQDLIFRLVAPEKGGIDGVDSVQAKCSADAARHMGRRRNSNECFGVCSRDGIPWYFTAADMKWYIDWLCVRGVNMLIPHAFYYSIDGKRKDERPPDVGPNNIWWKHYKLFSDYIKRLSYIMTDSKNCAETAVLCRSGDMKHSEVRSFYEEQKGFNYLTYSMLENAEVKNSRLCISGYEYKYVMGDTELGVKRISGSGEIENNDFLTSKPEKTLRVTHIVKNGADMYLAVNEGLEEINTEASVPLTGNAVLVDLWRGRYYGIPSESREGRTFFRLRLRPYESALLMFDESAEYSPAPERTLISGLDFRLTDENTEQKIYTAVYEKRCAAQNEYFKVSCGEMTECYINGIFCSVSLFDNEFDTGDFLHEGQNEIRLVVTGSAANKYSDKRIPFGLE